MAEGARLESVFSSNTNAGSNPALSATLLRQGFAGLAYNARRLDANRSALRSFSEAGLIGLTCIMFIY